MVIDLARLLLRMFPEVICNLLAALIFLGFDIKKSWKKVVLYSVLLSGAFFLTYGIIGTNMNGLRILINHAAAFALIRIIFGGSWWFSIKIFVSLVYLFMFLSDTAGALISLYILNLSPQEEAMAVSVWLKVYLPIYFISPFLAYFLRKSSKWIHFIFVRLKQNGNSPNFRSLYFAIIFHTFLYIALASQFYGDINLKLHFWKGILIFGATLVIIFLNFYIFIKSISITEEATFALAQNAVSESILSLVNSVRGQRHDFLNQIQIINSLAVTGAKEELVQYLSQLSKNISQYNDMLKVDNPILSGLLNTKMTQAESKGIRFEVQINSSLSSISTKAFDISRILGNLVDNALEAVDELTATNKWVKINIEEKGPMLVFSVVNSGPLTVNVEHIFEPGYTSKGSDHSGLGLYICQQLALKLHGKIDCDFTSNSATKFSLILPRF